MIIENGNNNRQLMGMDELDNNILPLNFEPPTKCYLYDAYPLSIMANHSDYLAWFFSNYIQVSSFIDSFGGNCPIIDFFERRQAFKSPWLEVISLSWEALNQAQTDIIDLIITHINSGYYFYGYVDEFYIPDRDGYHKNKCTHDILVYGFRLKEKIFSLAGYNKAEDYSASEVGFSEFENAFKNNNRDKNIFYWEDTIHLCKYNPNALYPFNLRLTAELLDDYLNSRDSYEKYKIDTKQSNRIFGMKVYEHFLIFLESLLANEAIFDLRQIFLLFEHKKCMVDRIEYIHKLNLVGDIADILESYKYIERGFHKFFNLMIKYSILNDPNLIREIIDAIDEILLQEKIILDHLLAKIIGVIKVNI